MDYKIDKMKNSDWEQVAKIYLEGINTKKATFQTQVPTFEEWDNGHIESCRLVARAEQGTVLGWVALTKTSNRCVYMGVAEVSIYIGEKFRGIGIGQSLLKAVIEESEKNGFWTLQSGIINENEASVELHKKCGFRIVGIREKIAKMDNKTWHDVVFMERRSELV